MRAYLVVVVVFLGGLMACEPDEQILSENPNSMLRFSADTVLFDTIFTGQLSVTKRLLVYNDDPRTLVVDRISLAGGTNSAFSIIVNGVESTEHSDLRLLGNDSMLILVDAFIDPQDLNNPYIVEDSVLFNVNSFNQDVNLIAWGQDANYLNDSILACNTLWTAERPYVIFNSVLVDSLCNLTVEPGTRVFSHKGSAIFVRGNIEVLGEKDNRVTFLNDRLDDSFENAPGQWDGIFFLEGSKGNVINNADIRNSEYGIWLGTPDNDTLPDLVLDGVRIENTSRSALIAFTSDLTAINCLFNTSGEFVVGNLAGGHYRYNHCTMANYSIQFFRDNPLLAVTDNLELSDGSTISGPVNFKMENSIVWGDRTEELLLNSAGGESFESEFANNILRTGESLEQNNILNVDPRFVDPFEYDYRIDSLSEAINRAILDSVLTDLPGNQRDSLPDLGAFEWIQN